MAEASGLPIELFNVEVPESVSTLTGWMAETAQRLSISLASRGATKVILLGYSAGANFAPLLVEALQKNSVRIDALIVNGPRPHLPRWWARERRGHPQCHQGHGRAHHRNISDERHPRGSGSRPRTHRDARDLPDIREALCGCGRDRAVSLRDARDPSRGQIGEIPTLLVVSTEEHPYFSGVTGGAKAADDWTRLCPHASCTTSRVSITSPSRTLRAPRSRSSTILDRSLERQCSRAAASRARAVHGYTERDEHRSGALPKAF